MALEAQELNPCPFCNEACRPFETADGGFIIVGDHEENCLFWKLIWFGRFEDAKSSVDAWNRRVK